MIDLNQLSYFAKYIESELGIVYSSDNYFQLQNRLEEIASKCKLKSTDELFQLVKSGPDANVRQLILDTSTNNETSFYRDQKVFHGFREYLVPAILKNKAVGRPLRIWSAACSTGQEPYSLAMICHELKQSLPQLEFEIFASDISERALSRAREARYSDLEMGRGLSAETREKYFHKEGDNLWALKDKIKSYVRISKMNLRSSLAGIGAFDIIFCRNVLIYQRTENKIEIIKRMTQQLEPAGFLVMGAGESMIGISDQYEQCEFQNTIFYRNKATFAKSA